MRLPAGHIAAALAALLSAGCISPHHSAATDVDPHRWTQGAEILVSDADTVTLHDAALFLRCNDRFDEDTLTVRIAVTSPDSLRCEEHFRMVIPRPKGPAALMREAVIPYRRRICFARSGDYRFTVTPLRPVRGVEAMGINLTKSE